MAYRTCASCGADLKGKRYGAKTCSDRCRQRLKRGEPTTKTIPGMEALDPHHVSTAVDGANRKVRGRTRKGR